MYNINYKKLREFNLKQKVRISNMVSIEVYKSYCETNTLPGPKTKQKIAYKINRILLDNYIYLRAGDLKLLVSSKVASLKSKIEKGKIPVYDLTNVYHEKNK